jgi:hypothetical protein
MNRCDKTPASLAIIRRIPGCAAWSVLESANRYGPRGKLCSVKFPQFHSYHSVYPRLQRSQASFCQDWSGTGTPARSLDSQFFSVSGDSHGQESPRHGGVDSLIATSGIPVARFPRGGRGIPVIPLTRRCGIVENMGVGCRLLAVGCRPERTIRVCPWSTTGRQ